MKERETAGKNKVRSAFEPGTKKYAGTNANKREWTSVGKCAGIVTEKKNSSPLRHIRDALILLAGSIASIISVAAIIVIVGCIYISAVEHLTGQMTFMLGYKPVYIESGSMEPEIHTGEIVLLKKCDFSEIRTGDIITFKTMQGYVTHRLVGTDQNALREGRAKYLITKGDANNIEDPGRLDPNDIEGRIIELW